MDFVDVVDLEAGPGGAVVGVVAEDPDVFDAGVRGAVDLEDVDVVAAVDGLAQVARAARLGRGPLFAVQRAGQDAGHRGLAHAARPAEEVRVGHAVVLDGALERLRDGIVAIERIQVALHVKSSPKSIRVGQDDGNENVGEARNVQLHDRVAG